MSIDRAMSALIDHTLLRADAVAAEVDLLCDEAIAAGFCTVCVQPVFVAHAARRLIAAARAAPRTDAEASPSSVGVTAVIGFPQGATTTATKVFEARRALADGATELDMVANLGWIRCGADQALTAEIAEIVGVAASGGALVKVILETSLFADEQKEMAARAAVAAGAAFVKTSTGFGASGATPHDVALLRRIVGTACGVKASGGIQTRQQALTLIAAGANRLGSSRSLILVGQSDEGKI